MIGKSDLIIAAVGVFAAMAMPYPSMAPFGISYLAGERKLSLRALIIFVAVSLGSIVGCDKVGAAKYIGAGAIYLTLLFVLERGVKISETVAAIAAAVCAMVTGLTTLYWQGMTLDSILLLTCEASTVAAGVFVIGTGRAAIIRGGLRADKLTGEEKLSVAAVGIMMIMGLKEIYIGYNFSVINMVASVVLLVVASGCGAMYSTICGIILGIACGIGTDYFMPVLGAFGFCGFVSGITSKLGKGGVISGLVIANAMLIVYTNGSMESILSIYEIMAASVIYAIIPNKITAFIKGVLYFDRHSRENVLRLKEGVRARLSSIASTFEDMAGTLSRLSDKENEADITDVAVLFDAAADKICKNCRRAPVCWGKEFNSTYQIMFKLLEAMERCGEITDGDMDEHFRAKCLNKPKLLEELSRQFEVYQVRRIWKAKLTESREIVGEQLSGMSKIINGLADEIERDVNYDAVSAEEIRARLEGKGFKVRDINVLKDRGGKSRATLVLKKSNLANNGETAIKNVMRVVLGKNINMRESVLEEDYARLEFFEEERFRVEAGYATAGASEKSGDNYSLTHLGCGKYVITISDGMGTGHRAFRESRAIIDLLDSFLRAGFDSRTAVKLINSIMVMKSENEAFVTVDMCIIDLYTGEAEFVKTGAEPSFIMKHSGVERVKSASLPVGVMTAIEAEVIERSLSDGDAVIMMTDGVESRDGGDNWIKGYIERSKAYSSAKDIADGILNRAIEENGGKVQDDITVISVKIAERH